MKFRKLFLVPSLFLSFSVLSGLTLPNKKEVKEVTADSISDYYYNVNGTGTALLESIAPVIYSRSDTSIYKNVTYDGLKAAYATTDVRSDGKLYDIYSNNTNYVPGSAYAGSYSDVGDGYNREHAIPKSWWGGVTSQQGSDLYIVLPSDAKANGMRSNYPYGETNSTDTYKLSDDPDGNKLGTSNNTNYVSGKVLEPFADRKGDLARLYFYAVAAYWVGATPVTTSDNQNYGSVKNWTSGDGAKVFSASENNGFVQKYLNMLLKWHNEDPVSQWEINRNNNVQTLQKNRNPFVDHPSWVDLIWGGSYSSSN